MQIHFKIITTAESIAFFGWKLIARMSKMSCVSGKNVKIINLVHQITLFVHNLFFNDKTNFLLYSLHLVSWMLSQ